MEDEEYKKLPPEEKVVHKLWKARVCGYEEVTKIFRQIDDEKSPEFSKYLGLVKKFVTDSNAMGQEKGLEATLAYIENYAHAGKTVSEVMTGIVMKCVAAPKTKTRELALQVTLMYIEIEKYEAVQEELIKGTEQKNPKIVAACIQALTTALHEFGIKIISPKSMIKRIGILFSDRDKGVRDEARLMVIELYKWMGPSLKNHLQSANLQAVQMTELEAEFAKIKNKKAVPLRYIRSQQPKQAKLVSETEDINGDDNEDEIENTPQEIDPYDLADPVDILSKLPKDFYEKLEAKKWQERKETLEALETLTKNPKLENGDYGDVVRALKKVVQKDSNVICVALAGRCIAGLASGLKKRFQTYSGVLILTLLEKFKEKKQNVVMAIREGIDATYLTTNLEAILEDVLESLNNKNPSVKSETSLFLARSFTKTQPSSVNKKLLKAVTGALTKNINESDPAVRETSAEALGTLMKLVGEKAIGPFLVELERDALKMAKIQEFYEKAEITVKVSSPKKSRPQTAPSKVTTKEDVPTKPVKKPSGNRVAKKKPAASALSSGSATVVRSKGSKSATKTSMKTVEKELDDGEVDSIVEALLSHSTISELTSPTWKTRLTSSEEILSTVQGMEAKSVPTQAVVKILMRKPGLKDTNFQVLKVKLDIIKYLAENSVVSTTTVDCCINDISEKFGDAKNGNIVIETVTAMAEATSLGHVSLAVLDFAFGQKSPKVQQEVLAWLSVALKEFGIAGVNVKALIDYCKKALASTNPGVRQASVTLLGTMYLYMGSALHVFFENEKPALRDQINAEFDKYEGETPPTPVRGAVARSSSSNSLDAVEDEGTAEQEPVNVQDLLPRVDISSQITDAVINELADKNWKVRIEALTKVSNILQEAKFIKPNISDLPQALATRLTDSNVKIAQTALNICQSIAKAMGPPSKQHIRTWFPGFLQNLGDSKAWMRTTALETIATFSEQCGYKEFFDGEMIGDALKSGSPTLRSELWNWLSEVLPKIPVKSVPKEELLICIPYLFSNLEDRNADVRKNAGEAILGLMIHTGYDSMAKQTEKLKPGSKTVVIAALEKARPNLPVKPLPKKVAPLEEKTVKGTRPVSTKQNAAKSKASIAPTKPQSTSNRKKEEDLDTSPLFVVNNLKHQRTIDESKLKVLKWNFTQPREEFVDLLRDQMAAANVNKTLAANMFHTDFRFHIKAIESLMEDLPEHSEALISNLDLILKWLTLRFFDTNPSVLLKGLEYLHLVFNMLIEKQYRMLENEGSCFIPYLVLKIGDPKDSVRNGVRALLKQISGVFPVSRLSVYVMEGVKSKNARQRAECLEVMGSMIEDYSITVCQPTPAACLKEVAKQISDRDNAVRNAALNCVVQAYNLVGDKVYKMVGNISDKDMSLLEERIKRASRRSVIPKAALSATVTEIQPSKNIIPVIDTVIDKTEDDQDLDEDEGLPVITLPPTVAQEPAKKEVQGPFKLESEFMNDLDKITPHFEKLPIMNIDTEFLKEEVKMPSFYDNKAKIMPLSPPKPVIANKYGVHHGLKTTDPEIMKIISLIGTKNLAISLQGLTQFCELMNNPNRIQSFTLYEEEFVNAIISLLKYLSLLDPASEPSVARIYRDLFRSMDSFYQKPHLGKQVSVGALKELTKQLVLLLVDGKLEKCGDIYVKAVNVTCVKVIEQSDHTAVLCALVKLITECISDENSPERQVDLVMKCLWKVIKLMPNWGEHVDYESVLLEVHQFLVKFPSKWWTQRPVDTPLRTIKTILHSIVKIKGANSMQLLSKISNPVESEIESYILRLLKSLKIAQAQDVPLQSQRKGISRANHNMLTDIFQKIGSKEDTKEGLNLLYDFMQQNPEADIEPFLSKSSKFFQDYIKSGLKDIETSRKIAKFCPSDILLHVKSDEEVDLTKTPEYFMERLNRWRQIWADLMAGKQVDHSTWPLPPTE
ncbi:protein mini spindles isoform X1 [Sitophilus oryzae]|uniref:Protein mini spindles isoform X1 n=1 Tax=Sitophilus oryzae TaxID=7048 RepID=A0A6J2YMY9_SITOR|nr:protein mini spindles isoform X1 [Sitophilus oryzae]XP_030764642.1 protein mini spindles isoform X1 [Sitophilus oryzae]